MKQLTAAGETRRLSSQFVTARERMRLMSKYRSRDTFPGFALALGRAGTRRRLLDSLRPEGGWIPLELELIEIVAELDPGMIDWAEGKSTYVRLP